MFDDIEYDDYEGDPYWDDNDDDREGRWDLHACDDVYYDWRVDAAYELSNQTGMDPGSIPGFLINAYCLQNWHQRLWLPVVIFALRLFYSIDWSRFQRSASPTAVLSAAIQDNIRFGDDDGVPF